MSYNPPPDPPQPGGYDPNQARGGGGYDPNATTPMGGTPPSGYPPQGGGYSAPPPAGGGYGAPPPAGGGYGAPPPPGGPGYYGGPPMQPVGTSWAAIVSLIAGILGIITCCIWCISVPLGIAAIALYFVAQGQLRQGMGGKGLAMAGLICGIIAVLLGILFLILGASLENSPFMGDILATLTAVANP